MSTFIIRRKTGDFTEFFRGRYMDRNIWTDERILAQPFASHTEANVAACKALIPSRTFDVVPMLEAPRRVETTVRRLSPETLAECRRVGGAA